MIYEDMKRRITVADSGCWEWVGAHLASGYGSVRFQGRNQVVHRVVWEQEAGRVPHGLQLDHLCRNRGCCNPAHLEPVTQKVNLLRGQGFAAVNAAKTVCSRNHALTSENTYVSPKGYRECRTCRRARRRAHYLRERAA